MRTRSSWLLLVVLAALLAAGCRDGGEEASGLSPRLVAIPTAESIDVTPVVRAAATPAPTSTQATQATALPASTQAPSGPLYTEDFEDGLAQIWALETGWQVSKEDGNTVLLGRDHRWANFNEGSEWTNYTFKFRLKVRAGSVHINYRLGGDGQFTRYFLSFKEGGLALSKQVGDEFTHISENEKSQSPNTWHTVEIKGFEGHLQVFVDGLIELDVTDADPLLQGTVAFESLPNSEVLVDDVEILLLTEPLTSPPPSTRLKSIRPSVLDYVDRPPPIASLITIGKPGPDGTTMVTGDKGSLPPLVQVMVTTVEYADAVGLLSEADGSFTATVLSAPGATIQVRYNPHPSVPFDGPVPLDGTNPWPGTLMRVPDAPVSGGGTPFSGAGSSHAGKGSVFWGVAGMVDQRALDTGEEVPLSGTLRIYVPAGVTPPPSLTLRLHFGIDPLFDADGGQVAAGSDFISRILTPTGLPIERSRGPGFISEHAVEMTFQNEAGALVASFNTTLSLPPDLPPGNHRVYLWTSGGPDLAPLVGPLGKKTAGPVSILGYGGATVALFTVGTPGAPRLSPALLIDTPNQGARGTVATVDRGRYELAARVVAQPDVFVVEPRDPGTGGLVPYRLEPFFPFLSMTDRSVPNAPLVPLDLPGGSLKVTVSTPSGRTEDLGTHPILQARTGAPATSNGVVLNGGGGAPGGVLQLTTLSDSFVYRFAEYGRYTVTLSGSVPDIWGREYPLDGTFEVWSAETLDVEAASLPSTPFQVGDRLPAAVNIYPGVSAAIEMSFELYPIDGSPKVTDSVMGTANRFGYFDGGGNGFEFTEAGEYVIRIRASYTDAEGRLWMGIRRWGSGVASASPALIAHGRRGDDSQPTSEQRAWFSRAAIGVPAGPRHISFPYHSGDIVWATDGDSVQMRVTVQDPDGQITVLLDERAHLSSTEGPDIQQRRVTGDLPLILSTNNGLEATFAVDAIDQWGYAYRAVERPGVRVRESIGTDATKAPYWRFGDLYLAQRGMGSEGDLPNDIKWQFGAAVFKRPDLGIGEVAIYGSLWVEIAKQDPVGSRVFPPFQGAAGGPSGGPIMTLKGQEIDLFVLPTGVRPGTILEVGDRFVFAGQVGPPLASKVTVRVTSPSGRVREFSGQANPIGYFSDPAGDFVVEEAGLWTVEVQVVHDGVTSAGPVEPPFPTGGVLGSADGRFQVYVVPLGATQLDFGLSAFGIYAIPSSMQMLFFPRIPEGWADVTGVYTITMPGFILEEGSLTLQGGVFELVYDPVRLSQEFLNIDLASRHGFEAGLADEVFISVMLTGTDASGQRVHTAKLLTLVGEDIYDLN